MLDDFDLPGEAGLGDGGTPRKSRPAARQSSAWIVARACANGGRSAAKAARSTSGAGMCGASTHSISRQGAPKKLESPSVASTPGTGTTVPARQRSTAASRRTSYGSKIPEFGCTRRTAAATGEFVSESRHVTFESPSVSGWTASTTVFSNPGTLLSHVSIRLDSGAPLTGRPGRSRASTQSSRRHWPQFPSLRQAMRNHHGLGTRTLSDKRHNCRFPGGQSRTSSR